ncbi:MAG TPA: protein kinase [Bacteroidota bacterium]|nr:protein kinase [Bacteroidota bacterium]
MKKIGKYEIVDELGRGGMGVVYKAYDAVLERDVALKVILQVALDVPDAKARFYREARMAGKLSHDAIAVIYEIGEDEGLPFIAMEYLPGSDLRTLIDNKEPLSLEQKLDFAKQICRGLQYAHSKNVIHRDIKPENIKILDDGRIKIIDFGIAKPYAPSASPDDQDTNRPLTRMGMRIGTPWYMSPEQAKGNPVDRRTDIFSFGVVLYELLTYRKPFTGDDTTVLYKILHEEPPPIELEDSGLTEDFQRILSRCLAKNHEERYGDCAEILRELNALGVGPSPDPRIAGLIAEGIALDKAEKYSEAGRKFNEVLELDPQNAQARAFLKRLSLRDKEAFMRQVLAGNVIGTIITHFQILDKIGGGGMGVVYRAQDMSLKRVVALKFLMPDMIRDPSAKRRFLNEAQAASALDHPNICTIHEISETPEGLLFICMAYYGGENLSARISRGPLSLSEALDIGIRIGRGLAKAHENGIVHRDIKPANIIITPDGEVKIVDFGLAKLSGGTQITRVGSRMGTLPFMSPEQIRGLELDQRTDIWSFAVLLFQALTGKLPFMRDYEAAMLYAIVTDEAPTLSSQRPGLPEGLDAVIAKALKKDVRDRYASAQAMVEDLEKIRSQAVRAADTIVSPDALADSAIKEGRELMTRGKFRDAVETLERAQKIVPSNTRVSALRAEAAKKLKEADEVTLLIKQGTALLAKGKLKEARNAIENALAAQPALPEAARLMAQLKERLAHSERVEKLIAEGDQALKDRIFDRAAESFRKVLEMEPENKEAQRRLKELERLKDKAPVPAPPRRTVSSPVSARPRASWWIIGIVVLLGVGIAIFLVLPKSPTTNTLPEEKPVESDSSLLAASARGEMLKERTEAEQSDAPKLSTALFSQAQKAQSTAEDEVGHHAFGPAARDFDAARALYGRSAEEAKREATAAKSDLSELKGLVTSARDEMLKERANAEHANGRTLASDLFTNALNLERQADAGRSSDDRATLQASRRSYSDARDAYKSVVERVGRIAESRNDADARKTAMAQAKGKVSASDADRKSIPSYKKALDSETNADRLYASGDYSGAAEAYDQAKGLFSDASKELASAAAEHSGPNGAEVRGGEKSEPSKHEREDRDAAIREITGIVESYRQSIEQGNLSEITSLLNLNADQQRNWSEFFKMSEKKVTIENLQIQTDQGHAHVTFTQKLSFENQDEPDKGHVETWTMESNAGHWRVIGHK